MKITPVGATPPNVQTTQPTTTNTAARTRAIEMVLKQAPQANTITEHPVTDANNISPEELSAIRPQTTETTQENQTPESTEETNTSKVEAPAAKDPELERRFQQIARQERALRAKAQQQSQQLKAREEALKAREAALEQRSAQPDLSEYIPKARLREDALGVLEAEGITTYDDIAQRQITRQPVDPIVRSTIEKLQAEINALKTANETSQKSYQEQQQAQYQAAIKQIKNDAKQLVYTDPEFETIKAMNATNDVVELIEETYRKDGVVMTVEEAAKEVENYLMEEALKITQIDKIKKRMAAANASRKPPEEKPQSVKQPQMKTLTNATSSTRPLTARERAIAAAEGRLKA